jgi:hypothetical protein
MSDQDKKAASFTVTDRRGFDASGEVKQASPSESASSTAPATTSQEQPAAETSSAASESARALPPADFATLVLSLGSSAVMYMGEAPGPDGKKPPRNLPMAKHAIDLLTVLEEKTKGNLTPEEGQILESLLFDLRLRYVESLKAPA